MARSAIAVLATFCVSLASRGRRGERRVRSVKKRASFLGFRGGARGWKEEACALRQREGGRGGGGRRGRGRLNDEKRLRVTKRKLCKEREREKWSLLRRDEKPLTILTLE